MVCVVCPPAHTLQFLWTNKRLFTIHNHQRDRVLGEQKDEVTAAFQRLPQWLFGQGWRLVVGRYVCSSSMRVWRPTRFTELEGAPLGKGRPALLRTRWGTFTHSKTVQSFRSHMFSNLGSKELWPPNCPMDLGIGSRGIVTCYNCNPLGFRLRTDCDHGNFKYVHEGLGPITILTHKDSAMCNRVQSILPTVHAYWASSKRYFCSNVWILLSSAASTVSPFLCHFCCDPLLADETSAELA